MTKNTEIYRYQAEKLLNTRTELTIYSKCYGIYLKKHLREQFSHEVEISINPQNEQELLLIEKVPAAPGRCITPENWSDRLPES